MKKRILFFVPCSVDYPSSQRRVMDYESYIRSAGIDMELKSYTAPGMYHGWITKRMDGHSWLRRTMLKIRRYWYGFWALISRPLSLLALLFSAKQYQGIFIQWLTPPRWFTRLLKRRNPHIAFDFDDAMFLKHPGKTEALIRESSVVAAGSHYNFEYARKINKNTIFLPTPVPADRFAVKTHPGREGKVFIGWIGSISTLPALKQLQDVLDELAERYPQVVLRLIGSGNRQDLIPSFKRIPLEIIPRIPYREVPEAVAAFDIGIMPLREEEWEKGKCLGKALEYMAAGVPAVVSRYGENVFAITDGVDGFLAASPTEWLDKLSRLVENPGLRRKIGLQGRKTVEARYSTAECAQTLIHQVLNKLIESTST